MRRALWVCIVTGLVFALIGSLLLVYEWRVLERVVAEKFSHYPWALPSRVYSAPLVVYPGMDLRRIGFFERLGRLGYRRVKPPVRFRGDFTYDRSAAVVDLVLHEFTYPTHVEPGRHVRLYLDGGVLAAVREAGGGEPLYTLEIEPEVITSIHGRKWEDRGLVRLGEVPPRLVQAVIAAEDNRFFEHGGVDWKAVLRASWKNLKAGRIVQGGSTLTQQLMKNFYLTRERTFSRKLKEAAMALITEHNYSKQEILENYLNEIYLGQNGARGIFGVREAANFYFGKELGDLTLGETALIAGLIRAPNLYSPFRNPGRAVERRNFVLSRMADEGMISESEKTAAETEPLRLRELPSSSNDAPYFVDLVRKELAERFGEGTLEAEGLRVFTTLDTELQRMAEEAVAGGLAEIEERFSALKRESPEERLQACLIAVKPGTGEIKALVGGRDYRASQFNRVTQSRRQPGSAFKPIVYFTALGGDGKEPHLLPTTKVEDESFAWRYDGRQWTPNNYRDHYWGEVPVRFALQMSLNAATAHIAYQIGIDRIIAAAHRLGIKRHIPRYPSIVLGSMELSPLEIATVYSVWAAGGVLAVPRALTAVVDADERLIEGHPLTIENVASREGAYLVTHLLEGVIDRGTGRGVRERGFERPAAGKTGTTNDYNDAWFAGYTPDLVAVVWVGFDQGEHIGLTGAQAALPIWTEFMKRAMAGTPVAEFEPPPGVVTLMVDSDTGEIATPRCPSVIEEAFLKGDEPKRECQLHGRRRFLKRELPRGPARRPQAPAETEKEKPWWFVF